MAVGRAQRRLAQLADQAEQVRELVRAEVLVHDRHLGGLGVAKKVLDELMSLGPRSVVDSASS